MPGRLSVDIGGLSLVVDAEALRPDAFAPFGDVIQNPRPDVQPSAAANSTSLPFDAVIANQGSAIKYQHVTRLVDLYSQAPSGRPGVAVANMFVCAARAPGQAPEPIPSAKVFPVTVLERHPYTTQTFVPLTADPGKRYLVVVAPSLSPTVADRDLPVPASPSTVASSSGRKLPGRGLPDLRRIRAFVATAEQAVTYGAGTWHAPMAALGPVGTAIDFAVFQFANSVPIEDCQEAFLVASETADNDLPRGGAVLVRIPPPPGQAKL